MTMVEWGPVTMWVHPICVIWNPYIRYKSLKKKNNIVGKVKSNIYGLCIFCNKNGYCIECDYQCCTTIFHVKCAVNNNLIKDYVKMIKKGHRSIDNSAFVAVFCKDHLKKGLISMTSTNEKDRRKNIK